MHWWKSQALREHPCVINLDTSLFPRAQIDMCKKSTETTRTPSSICWTLVSILLISLPAVLRSLLKLAAVWLLKQMLTKLPDFLAYNWFAFCSALTLFTSISATNFSITVPSDPQLSLKCTFYLFETEDLFETLAEAVTKRHSLCHCDCRERLWHTAFHPVDGFVFNWFPLAIFKIIFPYKQWSVL